MLTLLAFVTHNRLAAQACVVNNGGCTVAAPNTDRAAYYPSGTFKTGQFTTSSTFKDNWLWYLPVPGRNQNTQSFASVGNSGSSGFGNRWGFRIQRKDVDLISGQTDWAASNWQVTENKTEMTFQDLVNTNDPTTYYSSNAYYNSLTNGLSDPNLAKFKFWYRNGSTSPTGSAQQVMEISADGRVGINTDVNFPLAAQDNSLTIPIYLTVNGGIISTAPNLQTSDKKLKDKVKPIENAISTIKKLEGKKYYFTKAAQEKMALPNGEQIGFLAQDVEKIIPQAVAKIGDKYAMSYTTIIPILTEGIKEQQVQIESLQKSNTDLLNEVRLLKTGINELKQSFLSQSQPNPATNSAIMAYKLPIKTKVGLLVLFDNNGRQIQTYTLPTNNTKLTIQTGNLPAGAYYYNLLADGKSIASRKMIIQ